MHWAGLQRRARSAPLFLHTARHHLMGAATRLEVLLQQSAKLRAEAAFGLRARAARPVCHAYKSAPESNVSALHQVPRSDTSRPSFAAISQRRSALNSSGS